MDLNYSISSLNNVGPAIAKRLKKINLHTVGDLLYHIPFRHEDFRGSLPIKDLQDGLTVSVVAKVELIGNRRSFKSRKMITEALVSDNSGSLRIVWFNQPYVTKIIEIGSEWQFSGTVKSDMLGAQLVNPTFEKPSKISESSPKLMPIYSLTAGLSQKLLRFLIEQALEQVKKISDWLPYNILEEYDLLPLSAALTAVHFPQDKQDLANGFQRLKFDELFLIQLRAEIARQGRASMVAPVLDFKEKEIKAFVAKLPFVLTKPQKLSAWEILRDLNHSNPMSRLLSGDVGSGKTVVATMALYNTALNGYQSVLLAPTEILAKQHFDNISRLLNHLDIPVCLYTRTQFAKNGIEENIESKILKKEIIDNLKNGQVALAIGTHALLSDKIEFKKLGLAIVDEQHRFGVEQRQDIKQKGVGAHFLSLTATPIPRSLALTLYGDLDLSIIDELPLGRKPIFSRLVEVYNRQKAYDFIRSQIRQGRQAFVVCPLIENESNDKKSVLAEYDKLSREIFPDLKVDFLHGRLKSKDKELAMSKFKNKQTDILVSTSVVEVGIDIPNASVMIIEGAERFGLAQLHQFRGRVGRSIHQSYCFLFTDSTSEKTLERLKFFEKNLSGFKLAQKDLEDRGPGEVYGTAQSGVVGLRLAKLTDYSIVKMARAAAIKAAENLNKFPLLKQKINEFEKNVHLE